MRIEIGGKKYRNINELHLELLYYLDIEYSPLGALKTNMQTLLSIVAEYCAERREGEKGAAKASLTRQLNRIGNLKESWSKITSKEKFQFKYYNLILSLTGLSPLHGFGYSNRFGDHLKGNPEYGRKGTA